MFSAIPEAIRLARAVTFPAGSCAIVVIDRRVADAVSAMRRRRYSNITLLAFKNQFCNNWEVIGWVSLLFVVMQYFR